MNQKDTIYKNLIFQLEDTFSKGYYFECAWIEYVLLEDRLVSLLKSSGGHLKPNSDEIKMLGPKLGKLNERYVTSAILKEHIDRDDILNRINTWKDLRNDLMHSMANGTQTMEEIKAKIKHLAEEGISLVRHTASAARRLKKIKKRGITI